MLQSLMLSDSIKRRKCFERNQYISFSSTKSSQYTNLGLEAIKNSEFDKAIEYFQNALSLDRNDCEARLGLAKAYKYKKEFEDAKTNFQIYLKEKPNDVEGIVLLGEVFKEKGEYKLACEQFEKALALNPKSDYAKRNLLECQNHILFTYSPRSGLYENKKYAKENLKQAAKMAINAFSDSFTDDMRDVLITFDETASLKSRANIAQYEHYKRKITVSSEYIYSSANLVAAYLVHEFIHAKDNDAYTSIAEEQDAYRASAEFWIKNSDGISDPEMDYVVDLYKTSSQKLDDRVKEIYTIREPNIAQTSPNHPKGKQIWAFSLNENNPEQGKEPLKYTPVIA